MNRLRFLQFSDLHFGAPMDRSKLGLSAEKLAQRKGEFEDLVRRLPQVVRDNAVDVVFIPGDLWDTERLDGEQIKAFSLLYDALSNIPVPVVIAPGNHDYYSRNSFYHPDRLAEHGFPPWPEHILIFRSPKFETMPLRGWEGKVEVTGRAFADNTLNLPVKERQEERLLKQLPVRKSSEQIQVLLFHGSRDDANRVDHKLTAPFSRDELIRLNYDYTAIGHYHSMDIFKTDTKEIRGAYAGCPFGRGLDEPGEKVALVGEIVKTDLEPAYVKLATVPLDVRKITTLTKTVTGVRDEEELLTLLRADLNMYAQAQDMVFCQLQGRLPAGVHMNWEDLETRLMQDDFFHVRLDAAAITPAYDLDALRADSYSLESRFIQAMEARKQQVTSEDEKKILDRAMYIGLDALVGGEVREP